MIRHLTMALLLAAAAATNLPAQPAAHPAPPAASSLAAQKMVLGFGIDGAEEATTGPITLTEGSYAVFHTSEGDILVRLLADKAPKTVENFIGLSTGKKPWKHPVTMAEMQSPLYNNTVIYKTVENALLYGGDPVNRGVGEPGFELPLEISPDLRFDGPGLLAASLAGSNSSGSRWFLTLRSFPDWSGHYTIFGRVVGGLDVARAISLRPTKRPTVPLDPVLVSNVEILQIPSGKKTTAVYGTEGGKRFVTVDKNFTDAAAPAVKPQPQTAEKATSASAEATTPTATAKKGTGKEKAKR